MIRILIIISCFMFQSAMASSVIFSRDVITIQTIRTPQTDDTPTNDVMSPDAPTQASQLDARRKLGNKQPIITNHPFIVTIKNIKTTDPEWIIAQQELRRDYGILYLYHEAQAAVIEQNNDSKPYDILFIDSYGTIHAIAKNIITASLLEPLSSNNNTKALLYLNAGTSDIYDIQLNDSVQHKIFPNKPNLVSQ